VPAKGEIRIGIAGRRGQSFVAGLSSLSEVEIIAFCDVDPATLASVADRHAIPERYRDFGEMIDRDLDAVVVATPMQFHVPQSVASLAKGKHVLCEVTAAVSLAECQELADAVRASNRTYMLAENYCYSRANALVEAMVGAGLFGEIYYAEGAYIHDCHAVHYDHNGNPTWRTVWQVGRNGCTYGTHSLGPVLRWLDDRVVTVSCFGSGVHTVPGHRMDDTVTMMCQTGRGALVSIRLDMQSHRPHNMTHYALQGTRGAYQSARHRGEPDLVWIEGRSLDTQVWQSLAEYEEEFLPEPWRSEGEQARLAGHGGGDYFVAREFVRSIRDGTPPSIDVYRALDFTVPGLVSEASIARGGIPLAVPDFRPPS
jgi:predicted dehydrogenase